MRRTITGILLAVLLAFANVALAAAPAPEESPDKKIGLTLYLMDAEGKPMVDAIVLLQKNMGSNEAFEGYTDGRGAVAIPNFPLSSFLLAVRSEDDTVNGLVEISLYPGTRTEIMNKPQAQDKAISEESVQDTAFSRNVNGARHLDFSRDELPLNHYEVQVRTGAEGLSCLFQEEASNDLLLRGVGEGEAGEIAPEPTLPPDDEDRPQGSTAAASTPKPSASASPTAASSSTATAAPTQTSATATPAPSADASNSTPTPVPTTPAPTEEPSPTEPLVTPIPSTETPQTTPPAAEGDVTPAPTPAAEVPQPTSVPTTLPDYVNMKLFLRNPANQPLAYYVAVLNSVAQATCNEDGECYFTNVPAAGENQLVVRNTLGDQVGSCGLQFVEGTETTLGSVNAGGTYTITYAKGSQDVYVEIVVDVQDTEAPQVIVEEASDAPPSQPAATPTPSPTPEASAAATAAESRPADEVIGTPSTTHSGPSLSGYFSNEAGIAIPGATIRIVNEDTKNLSSSITNSDGAFGMGQMPPANYSLNAIDPQGRNLGTIQFTVARGKRTQVKTASDGKTYLTEGPNDNTVYMDLRELSNGTVDLMYASRSPLTAPAVLTSFSPLPSSTVLPSSTADAQDVEMAIDGEVVDVTEIQRPGQEQEADAGTVVFVVVLCAMGVAVAAILLVRRARIR